MQHVLFRARAQVYIITKNTRTHTPTHLRLPQTCGSRSGGRRTSCWACLRPRGCRSGYRYTCMQVKLLQPRALFLYLYTRTRTHTHTWVYRHIHVKLRLSPSLSLCLSVSLSLNICMYIPGSGGSRDSSSRTAARHPMPPTVAGV